VRDRNNGRGRLWVLRLLAFALALGLWFGISLSNRDVTATKVVEAQLSYITPEGMVLINRLNSVKVTVTGPESEIRTLVPYLVQVQVDLKGEEPGDVNVGLSAEDVILPQPELSVSSIEPNVFRLQLDRSVTRTLPLEPTITGEPAAGARVLRDQITVEPPEATITGPAQFVESLEKLDLTPINLDGHAAEVYTETAFIRSPSPQVQIVSQLWAEVKIHMDLGTIASPSEPAGSRR